LTPETFSFELRRSGRPAQALYRLEALAALEGWNAERLRLAGDLWREAGDLSAALAYWERTRALTPTDTALLRDFAEAAVQLNDWSQAADALADLRQHAPDDRWTAFQIGLIRAPVDISAVDALRAAAVEPAYADTANRLIGVLTNQEETAGARALRIGIVLADSELWSYAELAFSVAVDDPSATALALAYMGFARDKGGKDGAAQIAQAVALEPENARVRYLQGLHLRFINDFEGSLNILTQAVSLDPDSAAIYAELGTAYWLVGDRVTAEEWMRAALELSDGDSRYQDLINALYAEEQNLLEQFGIDANDFGAAATAESTDVSIESTAEATESTPEITGQP
jgi:tetratricopeptide (TPR) repeat protein